MSISALHISKAYNEQPVLRDFTLTLPSNGIIGLSGPSGCGKTTLLHILAGLIKPDSGTVSGVSGKRIGVVFQEDRLLPWLTAYENLHLISKNDDDTVQWLEKISLSDQSNYYPAELSGGMKRRIALARALAFECDLLLLDEPFQGLDQPLKEKMYSFVREAAEFKPVLMVSHDSAELSELADHIYYAEGIPMTAARLL